MTYRFNLSFTNDEYDLYDWLLHQKNSSGLIKDLLRAYRSGEQTAAPEPEQVTDTAKINALMRRFVGDDIENYGGESVFLKFNGAQVISNRVHSLYVMHPAEAAEVIKLVKEKYPIIGEML